MNAVSALYHVPDGWSVRQLVVPDEARGTSGIVNAIRSLAGREVRLGISLEAGCAKHLVAAPADELTALRAAVRASYPGCELHPVETGASVAPAHATARLRMSARTFRPLSIPPPGDGAVVTQFAAFARGLEHDERILTWVHLGPGYPAGPMVASPTARSPMAFMLSGNPALGAALTILGVVGAMTALPAALVLATGRNLASLLVTLPLLAACAASVLLLHYWVTWHWADDTCETKIHSAVFRAEVELHAWSGDSAAAEQLLSLAENVYRGLNSPAGAALGRPSAAPWAGLVEALCQSVWSAPEVAAVWNVPAASPNSTFERWLWSPRRPPPELQ